MNEWHFEHIDWYLAQENEEKELMEKLREEERDSNPKKIFLRWTIITAWIIWVLSLVNYWLEYQQQKAFLKMWYDKSGNKIWYQKPDHYEPRQRPKKDEEEVFQEVKRTKRMLLSDTIPNHLLTIMSATDSAAYDPEIKQRIIFTK